jgi:hypothetical protein
MPGALAACQGPAAAVLHVAPGESNTVGPLQHRVFYFAALHFLQAPLHFPFSAGPGVVSADGMLVWPSGNRGTCGDKITQRDHETGEAATEAHGIRLSF